VTASPTPIRALELLVGRAHVALPVAMIARVIDVRYAVLPLAHRLVVGLGFDDVRTIVCISLTPARVSPDTTKAVLLDTQGRVGFGFCIDEALELVDVVRVERGTVQASLPRWVRRAHTSVGRTLGWIDADILIDELSARGGEVGA
jgi:hypothetical protein